jgi:hypothetical protein
MDNNKSNFYELKVGEILTSTNVVIAIISMLPALLCFLFTADAFLPSQSSGTDSFPDPQANSETKILFSLASLLLLIFYRYVFINPFYDGNKLIKNNRLNYYLQVITVNLITLLLFINVLKDQFLPQNLNTHAEGMPYIYLFLYLPFVPLIIAAASCYLNLKQKHADTTKQILSNEN